MKYLTLVVAGVVALGAVACDSPLDVNPRASIPFDEALQDANEMAAAVMGLYDGLQASDGAYGRNALVFPDMYADVLDFSGTFPTDREVWQNRLRAENVGVQAIWAAFYQVVNRANNVIASLPNVADEVTPATLDRWHGEALFTRSLAYYNLVQFFGGVPVVTQPLWSLETDFQPARSTRDQVLTRIRTDLEEAMGRLPATTGGPYRATSWAAMALLAKTHLEIAKLEDTQQCLLARDLLNDVIGAGPFRLVDDFGDVFFRKGNEEMVFAVNYTINDSNPLAFWFFSDDVGGRLGFMPSLVYEAALWESPARVQASISYDGWGDPYGIKYFRIATGDDDVPVIRLADLHLLRAEANVCLAADPLTVRADIDAVRARAGDDPLPLTVITRDDLIDALLWERLVELGMEGHRFFDLRRMGVARERLGLEEYQLLFPIPQREMDTNSNLVQNPGY
jgi:starch-binding outer membrane protein, SusD/RagB family